MVRGRERVEFILVKEMVKFHYVFSGEEKVKSIIIF